MKGKGERQRALYNPCRMGANAQFCVSFFVCYGLSVYCLSLSLRGFPRLLLWRLPLLIFNKLLYTAPEAGKEKK